MARSKQIKLDQTPAAISQPKVKVPEFLAVDFFSGAGGTTRGLLDAGGYVIAGVDKDHGCERTYTDNNGNQTLDRKPPHYLCRDIFPCSAAHPEGQQQKLMKELDLLITRYKRLAPGRPLMFAICAPCQPFTTLARKELSEKRVERRRQDKNLLSEALKFVRRFRPDVVLSENVSGISDPRFGGIWEAFRKGLRASGYAVGSDVVCASKFGVPQFRKRSILVAVNRKKSKGEAALKGTLSIPIAGGSGKERTVASTISHLPKIEAGELHATIPNHRARTLSDTNLKRIASAKPGVSNSYLSNTPYGDLSLPCHRRVKKKLKTACFTDVYTRMSGDRPSPTITTKCHSISNGRFGHYDTTQNRGISLREAAALQSFRDDYVFYPEDGVCTVARMIGNAVPPRLAQSFAEFSMTLLDKRAFPSITIG
ncbi:DNA cytosine methyltransferase [Bradyrhizobium japonicum]|uniref:DNA cytosine methyltransferase n=1 Tax=Bradyrhizobium japonicum TaxID=375 RepID=UPI0020A089E8|nr:DNA cytosine methyltransferase [Bradyrhizobium japonicum]MCP1761162.1 DNA (cytosine-5)-methyltransferase 1 [Bradyrhizobium japonicum]MCP1792741.1 DNA (cytosine-5)-methyltransferase 1 [Bradyrhizobium japonicum]MCP1805176.1 DNA (cytosine-5)-methyltransferase 1 [Bradyrhizobium japonicum]MCP1814193.1 DNA (cytosine-5)-methyltransferase 1 [Bradyrhizobium japonicum]MCP1874378.1 DNA (cytosine-5)-methyltransferase 1 [Bradyrhizobium japonicum]